MDPQLTFDTDIEHPCKTSFYHLKNIAKLHPTLTLADAEKLVHAFDSSRLNHCNALLIGISGKSIQRLQYIQNSAADNPDEGAQIRSDHPHPVISSLAPCPIQNPI